MDDILDKVRDAAEGPIDFEGQKLAELLATALLATVGAISFIIGYLLQDINLALYIGLGGTALVFAVIVPPWPFFNKHAVTWLPVAGTRAPAAPAEGITIDGKLIGGM